MADTCITFINLNSNNSISIQRNNDSLCAFVNGISYVRPTAWNRTFLCRKRDSNFSVCFTDTMTSDAGEFNFIVGDVQENTTTLDVEYPPMVWPISTKTTIEGRNLSVTCSYTMGEPTATRVYWTKSDSVFRYDGQMLWIPNIEIEDSGTYVCHAENSYSSGNRGTANTTIQIDVQYPPSIQPFETLRAVEGTTLVIPCNVIAGNPAETSTQWMRDGVGFNQSGTSLVLSTIERSQSGTYVCMAQNTYFDDSHGEDNQSVTVDVEYPPSVNPLEVHYPTEFSDLQVYCSATPGNPPNHVFYWTRLGDDNFRQNGTYLELYSISRNETGRYICTAVNSYSTGGEGKDSQTLSVNVQYPPFVTPLPNVKRVEGEHVQITCNVIAGNPPSTTIYWTKSGDSEFKGSGPTLVFSNVSRSHSGRYSCVAENNYLNGGKGTDQELFVLNVLYGPSFTHGQNLRVSEGQSAWLTTSVTSNPASNVSWFRDNILVSTQQSVNGTTSYTITRAKCTDTRSFMVVASNGVQSNQSTTVSLYVYCSPRLATGGSSAKVTVGSNRYLNGQISVLSFPQPYSSLIFPSGALITLRIDATETNLFTITITKSNLQLGDFMTYVLTVANQYGRETIYVSIIPRGKPFPAAQVLVTCGHGQALVTWQSSYFGYEKQYSLVQYSTDNVKFINASDVTKEYIKEKIFQASVHNLQDSSQYFFRVFTTNTYGSSTSLPTNCSTETSQESSSSKVVGSVLGTLLLLAVGAAGFISYKYLTVRKDPKRSYDSIKLGNTIVNNHTYDTYEKQENEEETPKHSKTNELNPFKTKIVPKEISWKKNYSKLKSLDGGDTKKSISTEPNPTKTMRGERVYENIQDLSCDHHDLNRGKTSGTRAGYPQKENSKETKTKPLVPPKPKT
nr:contactin-5 isoform X2 [Crassostrea gigas]